MRESSAWSCRWTTRTCGRSAWRVPCVSSGCSVQVTNSNSDFKICRFVPTRRYDTRTQIRNFFFFKSETGSRQGRFAALPLSFSLLCFLLAASCPRFSSLSFSPHPFSTRFPSLSFYDWGEHLRSRSFHYHHHFPLLVAVMQETFSLSRP